MDDERTRTRLSATNDIQWMKILPSITFKESFLNKFIPFTPRETVHRGGNDYYSDTPHLVSVGKEHSIQKKVHIHIAGTGSSPTEHHVGIEFMSTAPRVGWASIALSYEWANYSDQEKNKEFIKTGNPNCQRYLKEYHQDVCFGGCTSPLTDVHISGSIVGRISSLLIYLAQSRPAEEKWDQFLTNDVDNVLSASTINIEDIISCISWSDVVLTGHSQGAGHVAFLAQSIKIGRVVLFSGPQEGYVEIVDDNDHEEYPHWLEGDFQTTELYAMMHKNEEGTSGMHLVLLTLYNANMIIFCLTLDLIKFCWEKIPVFNGLAEQIGKTCIHCLKDAFDNELFLIRSTGRLVETSLPHLNGDDDARPNHNSLTTDRMTPVASSSSLYDSEDIMVPVYGVLVWPYLLGCCYVCDSKS